jgi:2-aminoadipate transaminase
MKAIDNPKVYQYTISNGINELREQIALRYTNEGFPTTKENILITTGSQQAMYILLKFLKTKILLLKSLHI